MNGKNQQFEIGMTVLFCENLDDVDSPDFKVGEYLFKIKSIDDDGMIGNDQGDLFQPDELKILS